MDIAAALDWNDTHDGGRTHDTRESLKLGILLVSY
jgi:hypothetical protein